MREISLVMSDASSKHMPMIFQLRHEVFVVEQSVPLKLELDGMDDHATHLAALDGDVVVGTLRMMVHDGMLKIGRVAVQKEYRRRGIGSQMMEEALRYAHQHHWGTIYLDAQVYLIDFYRKLGFLPEGDIFMDAGIEHIRMYLRSEPS